MAFAAHDIACCSFGGQNSATTADLDGDGDLDVLASSSAIFLSEGLGVVWYENSDGNGSFELQHLISTERRGQRHASAGDLDGDGDLDVLVISQFGDTIAWYENVDGKGNFGVEQVINEEAFDATALVATDVDGDGDLDILFGTEYEIGWHENVNSRGEFGPARIITSTSIKAFDVADVDRDGDPDVVFASYRELAWFENTDGLGNFGPLREILLLSGSDITAVKVADLNQDNYLDVLASRDDGTLAWHENTDGRGGFGPRTRITTDSFSASLVTASDMDGDGDLDVLTASDELAWYENTNGRGSFGSARTIGMSDAGGFGHRFQVMVTSDVDGDGDQDVLASASEGFFLDAGSIDWYENADEQGAFVKREITGPSVTDAFGSLTLADLDGDRDMDLLSIRNHEIALRTNLNQEFGDPQVVASPLERADHLAVADLDQDGDLDVVSASRYLIGWYENTDSRGSLGERQAIATINDADSMRTADLDGDDDLDLLAISNNQINWYANTDGRGDFGARQLAVTNIQGQFEHVEAADMDLDGDLDLLLVSREFGFGKILWYENTDGAGNFGEPSEIDNLDRLRSMVPADLDGDGDMDVLSASYDEIVWYKNTDGRFDHRFVSARLFADTITPADVDGDGDLDVVVASRDVNEIVWFENLDGEGNFGEEQILRSRTDWVRFLTAADVDADGDLDLFAVSSFGGRITWYEQRPVGDANNDGIFTSADLVSVFQAGEYEDRAANNSDFTEGDWNGDGEFDSSDLVLAFQAGTYEVAASPTQREIASAVDVVFAKTRFETPSSFVRFTA